MKEWWHVGFLDYSFKDRPDMIWAIHGTLDAVQASIKLVNDRREKQGWMPIGGRPADMTDPRIGDSEAADWKLLSVARRPEGIGLRFWEMSRNKTAGCQLGS